MYKVIKTLTFCVAGLFVAEILAATYVSRAKAVEAPKVAVETQCMKNISTNDAFFVPCNLLTKYDIQAWVDAGQDI